MAILDIPSPRSIGIAAAVAVSAFAVSRTVTAFRSFVFSLPLVLMDITREDISKSTGPPNTLLPVRTFPTADMKLVVRPNLDTLYMIAWLDMAAGPFVLVIPPNRDRYEVHQLMDAYTNVFFAPGTRTRGERGGKFLLAGPNWTGQVPDSVELVRSPTRMVWMIGRTQTNGAKDIEHVSKMQDELRLFHIDSFGKPGAFSLSAASASHVDDDQQGETGQDAVPPSIRVQNMSAHEFFERVAMLLQDNRPSPPDASASSSLASLGIQPGKPYILPTISSPFIRAGCFLAKFLLGRILGNIPPGPRGWSTPPKFIGDYGNRYSFRALVALAGLGANVPEDAVYPTARVDSKMKALNGSNKYRIKFPAGGLPPVKAFWSITPYNPSSFLIDNPANRYVVSSLRQLSLEPDGSLEILVQAEEPPPEKRENWLPVKVGETFSLTARLYWPEESVLKGEWQLPAVELVG